MSLEASGSCQQPLAFLGYRCISLIVISSFLGFSLFFLVRAPVRLNWASLVAQTIKNLPAMQETQVPSLDLEDPLEKGIATHPSILAWRIPWTEENGE